jgi:phage shock protein A
MALITRLSRLVRADLHAVLDRMEEPGLLLRQAVREMEDELARDEQRHKALEREHAGLGARAEELECALAGLEHELDVCFASSEETLARAVIRRKLEMQRLQSVLARRRSALAETVTALAERCGENRTRLASLRQQAEILAEEAAAERADERWNAPEHAVQPQDVEVAFLREQQRRSRS